MKKHIIIAAFAAAAINAGAADEILRLTMSDGTEHTFAVSDITEMTFEDEDPTSASYFAGIYTGTQTLTVGGMYKYSTTVDYTLAAGADGTLTVSIPEYTLTGTMMGDLTLGALEIKGLAYDETRGGFYRDYASDGLTQHFKAVSGGNATMDKDYPLGGTSTILIVRNDDGSISVTNPFKLGAMPLPLTAAYEGTKK